MNWVTVHPEPQLEVTRSVFVSVFSAAAKPETAAPAPTTSNPSPQPSFFLDLFRQKPGLSCENGLSAGEFDEYSASPEKSLGADGSIGIIREPATDGRAKRAGIKTISNNFLMAISSGVMYTYESCGIILYHARLAVSRGK
ncbi:MAG: hypothetical protein ACT4O3_04535 [Elusimicrobiota bacterium]